MPIPQPVNPPRPRRSPTWAEQLVPTYKLVAKAIEAGDRKQSVALIDYIDNEWVGLNFGFYTQWHADTERFLVSKGISAGDLEGIRGDLRFLVNTHWNSGEPYDRDAELQRYRICKARLMRELNAPVLVALETLAQWKEIWRGIHDRDIDYASGLLNAAHVRFGEAVLEELYRFVIEERFGYRYAQFDVSNRPWSEAFDELVHVSIEAQRSHLVGPNRDGTMELEEFSDRVVLSFQPCATGGRTVAGDHLSGTPSRHLAPYYYNTVNEKHDFSWNKEGVCQYCTHCAMLVEKLPMERFGYPLRVIEPPTVGDKEGRCRWTMYRDLRDIPAAAYEAMGEHKPAPDEPLGSASRPNARAKREREIR